MIDLREHGGKYAGKGRYKPSPFSMELLPYPPLIKSYNLLAINNKRVVYRGGDNKTYVIDRKSGTVISSFYPTQDTNYYATGSHLLFGEWLIGCYRSATPGNVTYYKQNIADPTIREDISVINRLSAAVSFLYSFNSNHGYLCDTDSVKKFDSDGNLIWECGRQGSAQGYLRFVKERNDILYVTKNQSLITPINKDTGYLYSDLSIGQSGPIRHADFIADKLVTSSTTTEVVTLNQVSEDGISITYIKNLANKSGVHVNKDGIIVSDLSETDSAHANLYDKDLNLIKNYYAFSAIASLINPVDSNTFLATSYSMYGNHSQFSSYSGFLVYK